MKTFTIDAENNITVHASRKAAKETGLPTFASEEHFATVIGAENTRLVEIWNSLPGVKPVSKFANRKAATERIWKVLQSLGETAPAGPESEISHAEVLPEPAKEHSVEAEPSVDTEITAAPPTAVNETAPPKKARKPKTTATKESAAKLESTGAPRRQQDGPGGRDACARAGCNAERNHEHDGLAEAHGPGVHGGSYEKGGIRGRILQARRRRADLPHQPIAS